MRRLLAPAAVILAAAMVATAAVVAAHRVAAPVPSPAVSVSLPSQWVPFPGTPPVVAVPATGAIDVEDQSSLRLAARDADTPRPTGSVAKTMTALVTLRAHPLSAGSAGPVLTMTAADVALYRAAIAENGSAVPVAAGERLSERDVLLALMLPSANNLAETLARWVSGSHDDFVALLNRTAADLGMHNTHFDDPSGFSPLTVSSPADLVRLGRAALADAALAEIVATREATLPDGTVLHNLDALLGNEPGWLGIKTGETPSAGGCLLFAATRAVTGTTGSPAAASTPADPAPSVLIVGAVQGQPDLRAALEAARAAVRTAAAGYAVMTAASSVPPVAGSVTTAWGARSALRVVAAAGPVAIVRVGQALPLTRDHREVSAPVEPSAPVAEVSALPAGSGPLLWRLEVETRVAEPDWWWRLLHG